MRLPVALQEEQAIINNLYEFWHFIGELSGLLKVNADFKAIMIEDSDWPKRIFNLGNGERIKTETLAEITDSIKQNKLPNAITLTKTNAVNYAEQLSNSGFLVGFKQLGMIIELDAIPKLNDQSTIQFKLVKSQDEANIFASIASLSFKYRVDSKILATLLNQGDKVKLYIGYENNEALCCGLIFYDSQNYAGLHMIGTLPEARGKGLATKMTNHLMNQCIVDKKEWCVLHASAAGEPIYSNLGFRAVNDVITYKIQVE